MSKKSRNSRKAAPHSRKAVALANGFSIDELRHLSQIAIAAQHGVCLKTLSERSSAHGEPPLNTAIFLGNLEAVVALVKCGADLALSDKFGHTPLMQAAGLGFYPLVAHLIDHHANVRQEAGDGHTALHIAAAKKTADCCCVLVKHGAEVNATSANGKTPLHVAAEYGAADCCRYLLGEGAQLHARDTYGRSALDFAAPGTEARSVIEEALERHRLTKNPSGAPARTRHMAM